MKATIIGSGALGLCTAYYLNSKGVDVRVISDSEPIDNSSASFGNAGMIVPSHFVPLAAPGVIQNGLKWILDSSSPFSMKPRLSKDFVRWLYLFMRSANQKNVDRSQSLILEMNKRSRDLYFELSQEEELNFDYKNDGLMMLYKTAAYQDEEEEMAHQAKSLGLDVEILNSEALNKHESDLGADVLGGVLYKSDSHIIPNNFIHQLKKLLISRGVSFNENEKCLSLKHSGSKIDSVISNKGEYKSDEFIICAGAWSHQLAKGLNDSIPLEGGKGYHYHLKDVNRQLQTPSILCEERIAMTPMGNDIRVAGSMEIAGLDMRMNEKKLSGIRLGVSKYFSNFNTDLFKNVEPWVGLRPLSPDGLPYVGRSKHYQNLSYNTGHAMMGMSLAPVSGKLLSEILMGGKSELNLSLCSPNRF